MVYCIDDMNGLAFINVKAIKVGTGNDELIFTCSDGRKFIFYHVQDCCEFVTINDIIGDLDDLCNSPIVRAEERSNSNTDNKDESYTWTFYEFATIKGSVTVRWYGSSNGCYSESIDLRIDDNNELE